MVRNSQRQPVLKPQDFYLLLVLSARPGTSTYPDLATVSGLSMSEVHAACKRAEVARLMFFEDKQWRIAKPAFKEFLFHGAKYAFPALRGGLVAGIPTAYAAEPMKSRIAPSSDPVPVWPSIDGGTRGISLAPIYPSAPAAALRSAELYERLALFDALRAGTARERALAQELFEQRL